jgi:malate dehydrogenase (oxaloacetate-decarboxylating)(NADP+)
MILRLASHVQALECFCCFESWEFPAVVGRAQRATMSSSHELATLRQLRTDIERYEHLRNLQQDNAGLFFQLLFQHTEELLPYVYTPTVGQACQEYCQRGFSTRGLYLSAADKGR